MSEADRRQQILEGALRVFSKHGFHKASIKMIAKEAGIKSSALIYHYFDDKKALLEAILREHSPMGELPLLNPDLRAQLMEVPPEIVLPQIMRGTLALQDNPAMVRLMRLFISEAVRMPEVAASVLDVQQMILSFLVEYLQHQIDTGTLKPHNAEMSARMLVGAIGINLLGTNVFTRLADGFGERDDYIEQVVQIFLNGVRSEG